MSAIDLLSAAQEAAFTALKAGTTMGGVYDHVPENTDPPFHKIGAITSSNECSKGEQLELIRLEIVTIYRGPDRGVLLMMMHEARTALEGQQLTAAGASFETPNFISASASDAGADGITYAGLTVFEFDAEPA